MNLSLKCHFFVCWRLIRQLRKRTVFGNSSPLSVESGIRSWAYHGLNYIPHCIGWRCENKPTSYQEKNRQEEAHHESKTWWHFWIVGDKLLNYFSIFKHGLQLRMTLNKTIAILYEIVINQAFPLRHQYLVWIIL